MKAIEIISQKCNSALDKMHVHYKCNPYVIISKMQNNGYVLTLISNDEEFAFNYRQSEFITLDTDIDELLEILYNRTT